MTDRFVQPMTPAEQSRWRELQAMPPGQPISQEQIDAMAARREWVRQQMGTPPAAPPAQGGADLEAEFDAALDGLLGPAQGGAMTPQAAVAQTAPGGAYDFNSPAFNPPPAPPPPQGLPGREDRLDVDGPVPPNPTPDWMRATGWRLDDQGRPYIAEADPGAGEGLQAFSAGTRDLMSASFDDEISGLLGGDTEAVRAEKARLQEAHPWLYGGGQLVGGVGGSLAAALAAPALGIGLPATWQGAMLAGMGTGAASGAAYGAGSGTTPEERLQGAESGAVTGGALGFLAPGIGHAVGAAAGPLLSRGAPAPTTQALEAGANRAYQAFENSGLILDGKTFNGAMGQVAQRLQREGLDPQLHPRTTAALQRVMNASPGSIDVVELQTLRRLSSAARNSPDADEARLSGMLVHAIDNFMDAPPSGAIVGGNAATADQAWRAGRTLWQQFRKAEEIDEVMRRAEVGDPAGLATRLRQEYTALTKNFGRFMQFSPAEREVIQAVADGTPLENAVRKLGRLSPDNPFSTTLAILTGGVTAGVGLPARGVSNMLTKGAANRASDFIHRGGPSPIPYSATADTLTQALAFGGSQGAAVPYFIDHPIAVPRW